MSGITERRPVPVRIPVPISVPVPVRSGRRLWWLVSVVVVAAVFGFLLPQLASYQGVWADLSAMPWPKAMLVAGVGAGNLIASWIMIVMILPSLRLREAAVLNLGPTAVANTLPAGEAVALGLSWAMLSSWGIKTRECVLYTLVSGAFNIVAKLGLPILALAVLVVSGESSAGLTVVALASIGLLVIGATAILLALHGHSGRAVQLFERLLAIAFRLGRRPAPPRVGAAMTEFRGRTSALLAARGGRIALAVAATHLSLAIVLVSCLYASGVTQAQVPWQTALAGFAFARWLSALPITPGGVGVVELGLTGFLSAGLDAPTAAKVTAAVLLFRAITYLLPIPLGAIAYLAWRSHPTAPNRPPVPAPEVPRRPALVTADERLRWPQSR